MRRQKCSPLQIIKPLTSKWSQVCSTLQIIKPLTSKWSQECSPLQIIKPLMSKWSQKCSPLQIIKPMMSKWSQKCNPLQIIKPLTSKWSQKCSPLQIMKPLTSKWSQKCSPLQIVEPLTKKTRGRGCFIKERNGCKYVYKFERRKCFEWIIKQLLIKSDWSTVLNSYSKKHTELCWRKWQLEGKVCRPYCITFILGFHQSCDQN